MASIPSGPADYGILSSPTIPTSPPDNLDIYEMGPIDLANYFIKIISRKWGESLTRQDLQHVPTDVSLMSTPDQLVVYNPRKNHLYWFCVDEVPKEIVRKVERLAQAQEFGVGCFKQLYEELRKAIQRTGISEDPEEEFGKGVEGAVAMLRDLSLHVGSRVRPDLTRLIEPNDIKVHVVLVNSLGESHRYSHFLRPDADLESFLKEMDQKFPMHCDPYDEWAYKDWYSSIQHLKKTGMNGDPMLYRIEGLILLHQATKNKELPQWMYYTIRDGVDGEELDIHDEESFKAMMNQAAENNAPACLIRITEAKFRNIFVELKFLEENQLSLARSKEEAQIKPKDDSRCDFQQPGDGIVRGEDSDSTIPFFDDDDPYLDPKPLGTYQRLSYFYNLDHNSLEQSAGQKPKD